MSSIWNSSLGILARREHSARELQEKLLKRYPEEKAAIDEVLLKLQEMGLQDDRRFAELWLRSQVARGRGPVRIRGEARHKGIEPCISQLLEVADIDWFEQALLVASRKFSSGISLAAKAKAYRFLSYRGFESDAIQYALNTISQQVDDF